MPLLVTVVLLVLAPPAHAAERWRWPVRGEVITPFHLAASPFARGQHRGIDIAAAAGARVRSACTGRVTFAGRVPGRERAVSVRCGGLVATHLELATTAPAPGAVVEAGEPIGTVAASHLQLGARRAGEPHGYVDPQGLLRGVERSPPAPPPLGVAPREGPRAPPPANRPAPVPAERPAPAMTERPAPAPARVPLPAWLGLALVAAGTPLGALWRRRRRHRLEPAPVARGWGR